MPGGSELSQSPKIKNPKPYSGVPAVVASFHSYWSFKEATIIRAIASHLLTPACAQRHHALHAFLAQLRSQLLVIFRK